jgi:Txe/YoeB family toxin of Txe-Axe toxin-antitoxin module
MLKRINRLIDDALRDPASGIAEPDRRRIEDDQTGA